MMRRLFPQCDVNSDRIEWSSGNHGRWDAPYVHGNRGRLMVDGELNSEELQALAAWDRNAG
jgi:hypothetical protein